MTPLAPHCLAHRADIAVLMSIGPLHLGEGRRLDGAERVLQQERYLVGVAIGPPPRSPGWKDMLRALILPVDRHFLLQIVPPSSPL